MAKFLLTRDNIKYIKIKLSELLPDVKSSHLTEAIASGIGFNSNAAMLSRIKDQAKFPPYLSDINDSKIATRLNKFCYANLSEFSIISIVRSVGLPQKIWVEFPSGNRGANERWYSECKFRNLPNLRIEKKKKFATLSWDCISINKSSEGHLKDEGGTTLGRLMFQQYQRIARQAPGKSEYFGTCFVGSVKNILPELAHEIADEFFTHLYEPISSTSLKA